MKLLLVAICLLSLAACAGSSSTNPTVATAARAAQQADRGRHQFRVSCSGCHGVDARGNGPVAPFLAVAVPDLTLIAARQHGVFPADEVYRIIDGQADLRAHGPRHMPVWGYEFYGDDPDDESAHREATLKIEQVLAYLRSIQRDR